MLKNINSLEVRSLEQSDHKFFKLPLIAGSGKITIEGSQESSGPLTTITIEAKLHRYDECLRKPLAIHVQWHDDEVARDRPYAPYQGVAFGDAFLPAHIEYEDDEVLKIVVKYQTPLSFAQMRCINV